MDVSQLSENSLKLKIKKTNLIVNPTGKTPKTEGDAVIATIPDADIDRVKDYRVFINSTGEYEVGGLKISCVKEDGGFMFIFNSDGKEIAMVDASTLSKIPADKVRECAIALINADIEIPENVITAMEPRAIVLYGEKAKSAAQSLGKSVSSSTKVSIAEDKLPEETAVYLLS
ncbi:MAG: hypothetical protein A3B38_00865 [Candidatus Levybacteria bacterium RIFCSPLOWO2_01_FULL_36_13]|nr:MAG: hypothetical protein A2684_02105 [Candidatus Levybacteria bacterium RIFCSPHIGHO2_01_FULL_36_15b]OGH35440.1 MAG: hypothetical protein A3B38_00865 [Candidatus Levybacteria bacterium RIFCSPLOWO2_01_FULL_36_13]